MQSRPEDRAPPKSIPKNAPWPSPCRSGDVLRIQFARSCNSLLEATCDSPAPKPGMLFQYDQGYFLWFTLLEGSGSGFICIANLDPNLVGQSQSSLSEDRLFIAPTISVQRRQNSN